MKVKQGRGSTEINWLHLEKELLGKDDMTLVGEVERRVSLQRKRRSMAGYQTFSAKLSTKLSQIGVETLKSCH